MQIAKSRGIDFAALPKEKQNIVIGELFAHLEGIFRDMADYPDDRFGRRKGIYKNSFANPSEENNPNNQNNPNNSIQTTSDTSCPDQGCDNKNCLDVTICYESKSGEIACIDDECKNNGQNAYCVGWDGCLDRGGCTNEDFCQDEGSCTDGNAISTCINGKCINASTSGCVDVEGKCINAKCIDLKKVVDEQNPTACTDNMCDP